MYAGLVSNGLDCVFPSVVINHLRLNFRLGRVSQIDFINNVALLQVQGHKVPGLLTSSEIEQTTGRVGIEDNGDGTHRPLGDIHIDQGEAISGRVLLREEER